MAQWQFFVGYLALGPGNAFCPACGGPVERSRGVPLGGFVFAGGVPRRCCRRCLAEFAGYLSDFLDDEAAARVAGWRGSSGLVPRAEYAVEQASDECRVQELPAAAVQEVRLSKT